MGRRDGGEQRTREPPANGAGWRPIAGQARGGDGCRLQLLGSFGLNLGEASAPLPHASQRLVACLAVADRPQPRSVLAGRLWPDVPEGRALARLRSALWRLPEPGSILSERFGGLLALRSSVRVDVDVLSGVALRILDGPIELDGEASALIGAGELLPGWDEEWLVARRERFRQLRLHALEHVADRLTAERQFGRSIELCLTVLSEDPFRESAQRLLVRAFEAEGNLGAALAQYRRYREMMRADLGLAPSAQMEELIARLPVAEEVVRGSR